MRYQVLGPLAAFEAERRLDLGAPQQRAVLAVLLVEAGRTVSTATLLERVWGEDAGPAASTSLQVVISRLRKRLSVGGASPILTAAPGYRLEVAREDVDAHRFTDLFAAARRSVAQGEVLVAREQTGAALALWHGQPYANVRADVVSDEVARLDGLWLAATELAAELDLVLGHHEDVAARLPAVVAAHPLREGLRGALLLALYRCGEQAAALALYEQTRTLLAEELGTDPSPQLQRLHELVLRQDPVLDAPAAAPAGGTSSSPGRTPSPGATSPHAGARGRAGGADGAAAGAAAGAAVTAAEGGRETMVGREEELTQCLRAWRRAAAGTPSTVALVGEAGIGKTRLAQELGRRVHAEGAEVVWGRCTDGGGAPAYWPWRQVLTALAASRGPAATARALQGRGAAAALLLPQAGGAGGAGGAAADPGDTGAGRSGAPDVAAMAPEAARTLLFEAVTAFLEQLAAEAALTVVVEDLHWADPETLQLTEHVVTRATGAPLCLVLTVRDPEAAAAEARDRVLSLVSRLPHAQQVVLRGLSTTDVQRYAAQQLAAPVEPSAAQRLHERTNGNPFFIAELVRLLGEERASRGRADLQVPRSVQAVLERRLVHLGTGARQVLEAAAVLGREFEVRLLAELLSRTPLELADDLDAATAAGIVHAEPGTAGTYLFTHALVQEVLLAATGPMRRAALHARAADVLENRHGGDLAPVAAYLAHHHVAAGALGDPERAVRACLLAAEVAGRHAAHAEAEQHLRTALGQVSASAGSLSAQLELEVRVRLGSLLTLLHGYNTPEVAEQRRRAVRLAEQVGTTHHLLSALWGAWGVALVSGDLPAAEAAALELARAADRREDLMLRLAHHHALGQVRLHQGRLQEARADLLAATALAEEHREQVDLALFLQHPAVTAPAWLAVVLTLLGEDEEAEGFSRRAREAGTALGHDYTSAYRTVLEGWRAAFRDDPQAAAQATEAGLRLSTGRGFDQLTAFATAPHGWALARLGRTAEGVAELERALEVFGALPGGHMFGHLMLGALAEALAAAGRWPESAQAARRAVREAERTGERFFLPRVHLALAQALARTGAGPAEVEAEVQRALAAARATGAAGLTREVGAPPGAAAGQRAATV
ncbi:ATP-binding protein [Kineococcus sp. SYSU DK006]|uniref:ATP-binding protein n=1 Tax=Kineococcus sp. SYSU DK006 TaxID=3383127 RepID=UPI003D7D5937